MCSMLIIEVYGNHAQLMKLLKWSANHWECDSWETKNVKYRKWPLQNEPTGLWIFFILVMEFRSLLCFIRTDANKKVFLMFYALNTLANDSHKIQSDETKIVISVQLLHQRFFFSLYLSHKFCVNNLLLDEF